jgi:hypothetical protein
MARKRGLNHAFDMQCRSVCTAIWRMEGHGGTLNECVDVARSEWSDVPANTIRSRLKSMHGEVYDGVAMLVIWRDDWRVMCKVENLKELL